VDEENLKEHPCFSGVAQTLQVHTPCSQEPTQSTTEENRLAQGKRALAEQQARLENERRQFEADKNITKQECTGKLKECHDALKQISREQSATELCPSPIVDSDFGLVELGQPFAPSVSSEGITDTQMEIVHALRAGATKKLVDEMKNVLNLISKLEQEYHGLKSSRSSPTSQVLTYGPAGLKVLRSKVCTIGTTSLLIDDWGPSTQIDISIFKWCQVEEISEAE